MSNNLNISVLVAARDEYIEQLKCIIVPLLIQGFNSIYSDALRISEGKKTIYKFQELLKEIPNWNQTILQEESKRIKKKCPYIMDIVTAIFVSNVKILASIRLKGKNENIRVKIPTSDIFIHSNYIESAQHIFYDPFLFHHRANAFGRNVQDNKEIVKRIIRNAVDETIRQMLPFDDILREYLENALDESESESGSESGSDPDIGSDKLDNSKIIGSDPESDFESDSDTEPEVKNFQLPQPGIRGKTEYFGKEPDDESESEYSEGSDDSDHGDQDSGGPGEIPNSMGSQMSPQMGPQIPQPVMPRPVPQMTQQSVPQINQQSVQQPVQQMIPQMAQQVSPPMIQQQGDNKFSFF